MILFYGNTEGEKCGSRSGYFLPICDDPGGTKWVIFAQKLTTLGVQRSLFSVNLMSSTSLFLGWQQWYNGVIRMTPKGAQHMQKKASTTTGTSPAAQQRAVTRTAKQRAALNYGLTADDLKRGKHPVAGKKKGKSK